MRVPAREVTDALLKEVDELRKELVGIRQQRETELRSNILTYIQALPDNDLGKLTSDMSQEVTSQN
jgi:DNA-dependent RNA polymerase auxiliary subunit epsilon